MEEVLLNLPESRLREGTASLDEPGRNKLLRFEPELGCEELLLLARRPSAAGTSSTEDAGVVAAMGDSKGGSGNWELVWRRVAFDKRLGLKNPGAA
jgi:hypothetical protein